MARHKIHPDALVSVVAEAIDRYGLIAPHSPAVVGVSGGLDSVVLLAALHALSSQPDRKYRLTIAHLNHCLRDGADADEAFVADLAAGLKLPVRIGRCDVAARARTEGVSIETAARAARYEFLCSAAGELDAGSVAVGHHADDNVETVLHRILRGTHLRGLAGIPIARDLGGGVRLVRPLLRCRRDLIRAYAGRMGLAWRTDETNADTSYTRNLIRHEVLGMLRDRVNPRVDEALLRLAGSARQAEDYLVGLGGEALARALIPNSPADPPGAPSLTLDRTKLAATPPLVRTYAMRAALERLGAGMQEIGADRLADLDAAVSDDGPPTVGLPGRVLARRAADRLILSRCRGEDDLPAAPALGPAALHCPGRALLADGRSIVAAVGPLDRSAFDAHCRKPGRGVHFLDADRLVGPLSVRSRRNGDAFWPLGAPGRQSVGDFLTNAKLPRRQRDEAVCVCDELGIVCLAPHRIDERVKVASATARAVVLKMLPAVDA